MAQKKMPSRLDLRIGGYMGTSYSIVLKRTVLHHITYGAEYVPGKECAVRPTDEAWTSFLTALDSLRVWEWRERYDHPGMCDGTSWKVDIVWDNRHIGSSGSNSFPRVFEDYLEAVRALVGGLPFS